MRITELLQDFHIQRSNEEQNVLDKCTELRPFDSFSERDRSILENLIRKALVSKVMQGNTVMVKVNEF
ncbi:MAG: hypothetical protein CL815_08265 [Coraliomargarita sp.]|nr:hypothetical protein [Coraliomargarita sp.]|tara:strand:- start:4921 stop:5124 length:204 start_codon:yes stop_codon:yes gene_type:complete